MSDRILFLIFISLIVILLMRNSKREQFNQYVGRPIHARLDDYDNNKVLYFSWQMPSGNGEYGCTQVPCPKTVPDYMVCWDCCNYH